MMRNVYLYGELAEKYGSEFRFKADSVAQVVRLLQANFPDFNQEVIDKSFHIVKGKEYETGIGLCEEELTMNLGKYDLHIVPVIAGSGGGKSGIFQIILGVVMVALAIFVPGAQLALLGIKALSLGIAGGLMILGGIIQMLTPQAMQDASNESSERSFIFDGAVNNYRQGGPVSVVYGRTMVSATTVSSGFRTINLLGQTNSGLAPLI